MIVKLLAFSRCAEALGAPVVPWEAVEGMTVAELLVGIQTRYPRLVGLNMVIAVNHEVVPSTSMIKEGDEIALLPPVSGG